MPFIKADAAVDEVKPIQGKVPDSVEEYRVAKALYKVQIPFEFQWLPPLYRYGERGSTVVDFLLKTAPLPTPLFIDGKYFHQNQTSGQDELLRARLFQAMAGRIARPRSIPDTMLKDQDMADAQIRMLFGGI